MKKQLLLLLALSALIGCSKEIPPSIYSTSEVGVVTNVKPGIVVSSRMVKLDKTPQTAETSSGPTSSAFQKDGYEYVVQLEDGTIISIIQNEQIKFKNNQRVFIIYGKTTRIVSNDT
jgi:outer membrane lipoprotein SlyB